MVVYKLLERFPLAYEFSFRVVHFPTWRKRFAAILPHLSPGRTLEIGCGTGNSSKVILGGNPDIIHLDINPRYLCFARKRGVDDLVLGDGCCLPFLSGSFAQVVVIDAFHHIFDSDVLFREAHRVLEEGGRMIVFDPVFTRPAENAWVCDIGDGPIWKHTVERFREKIGVLSRGRFREVGFERSRRPSLLNAALGMTDAICVLKKR